MISRNLRNTCRFRIGAPQCRARHVQPSQQVVPDWAHSQKFRAAKSQGPLRHADRSAELRQIQMRLASCRQGLLKANHDVGMAPSPPRDPVSILGCQAIDERMKQLLLEGSRNLGIGDQFPSGFGEPARFRKRAQQRSEGTGLQALLPEPSDGGLILCPVKALLHAASCSGARDMKHQSPSPTVR